MSTSDNKKIGAVLVPDITAKPPVQCQHKAAGTKPEHDAGLAPTFSSWHNARRWI
jgi:hypothetical protein